jgi:hypothetical protein
MVSIKVYHGEVIRRLVLHEPYVYQTLLARVLGQFELDIDHLQSAQLLYFDQDGFLISMSTDVELTKAIGLHQYFQPDAHPVLRLKLVVKTSDDFYESTDSNSSAIFVSGGNDIVPSHEKVKSPLALEVLEDAGHVVKFMFEKDMYKIKLETLSFENIKRGVADRLGILCATLSLLRIRYQDSDGDEVSISNESDLTEALREKPGVLKLLCSLKQNVGDASMTGTVLNRTNVALTDLVECELSMET